MIIRFFNHFVSGVLFIAVLNAFAFADCGHIKTWSDMDAPQGSDWSFYNNVPTQFCPAGFPNLSPSEEGSLRTCFNATSSCAGVWLDLNIISYETDQEARTVYDVFRSDPIIQQIAEDKFNSLISADNNHLLTMGGTYTSTLAHYGLLNLYAIYRGTLINIERVRGHLPPATPPLDDMIGCWNAAYMNARSIVDKKCGVEPVVEYQIEPLTAEIPF